MELKVKQTISFILKMDRAIFHQKISTQFACECGKAYGNFSALYLHFQRSHKIKISTKLQDHTCSVSKTGNTRIFTYFYSQEKAKCLQKRSELILISTVLHQFVESLANEWDKFPACFLCSRLYKYLVEQKIFENCLCEQTILYELPTYYNDFLTKISSSFIQQKIKDYYMQILLSLSQWLNMKGFSKVSIEIQKQQQQQVKKEDRQYYKNAIVSPTLTEIMTENVKKEQL